MVYGDVQYLKDRMAAIEQYLKSNLNPRLKEIIESHKVQVQDRLKELEQVQ